MRTSMRAGVGQHALLACPRGTTASTGFVLGCLLRQLGLIFLVAEHLETQFVFFNTSEQQSDNHY